MYFLFDKTVHGTRLHYLISTRTREGKLDAQYDYHLSE